jgi:hypothetical protein
MCRRRQPNRDVRRKTIARHDVESDTREQHHIGALGVASAYGQGLEHGHLAGDVEIVYACPEARLGDGDRGAGKRASAVEDHGMIDDRRIESSFVVD